MTTDAWSRLVGYGLEHIDRWERKFADSDTDSTLTISEAQQQAVLDELGTRLQENYPFFHPDYAGQMLKPPHQIAAAAYAMAQRINPNAHALDGGPATAKLEHEVVAQLAGMFGYDPATSLGHLTSSGTIANLEALWVARELHPDHKIAFSTEAHYAHGRMCQVLGVEGVAIEADRRGRIDLDALESALSDGNIGTVVATAGTTSLGAVDPIVDIVALAHRFDARVHVDAAYGGFFNLLATIPGALAADTAASLRSIANADSIVVDPHKHGLQPYGCGSVLFRDASVGRFYKHDSPYTYFTSDELHLGEISLECSRAGAAAAALWATLQVFPLAADEGIGPILRKTSAAARRWAELIQLDSRFRLVVDPELDIVCFYPLPDNGSLSAAAVSELTQSMFADLMNDPAEPLFLATLQVKPAQLQDHQLEWDRETLTTLRSVLMKPEHLQSVERFQCRLRAALERQDDLVRDSAAGGS